MAWFGLVVLVSYIMIIGAIIPKSAFEFDMFKIKFRLLPYWARFLSLAIIVVALVVFAVDSKVDKAVEYLISTINLALFVILFSKQKFEDEYTEKLRFKSFVYSFSSFVALVGALSALSISSSDNNPLLSNLMLNVLIGTSMLMALSYFNITLYKFKKENI